MASFTVDFFSSLDGNGSAQGSHGSISLNRNGPEFDLELIESTVLDGRTQKLVDIPHLHEGIPEGVGPQRRGEEQEP